MVSLQALNRLTSLTNALHTTLLLLPQVLASLWLYRQILDAIEANDYDNFTKRAYVGKAKKLLSLPVAYARAAVAS